MCNYEIRTDPTLKHRDRRAGLNCTFAMRCINLHVLDYKKEGFIANYRHYSTLDNALLNVLLMHSF